MFKIMNLTRLKNYHELKQYLKDPLYKNSFFLVLGRSLNVTCGFFFWILAARLYSIEDLGIATALISSLSLVMLFSRFGFDFSLIRFLPLDNKSNVFNTCLIITTIASLFIGMFYISGINLFSPGLSFLQDPKYTFIFLFFALLNSVALMTGNTFLAIRKAEYYFFQNIFLALRIPLLIPLVFLGASGIFAACGLAYLLAAMFAFPFLSKFIKFDFHPDKKFIKESFRFSSGNYFSKIFSEVPLLILPIMVLNFLGEAETAKYYLAYAIGNLVFIVPDALSTSLFVEGSHGEGLKKNAIRAVLGIYAFLIPAAFLIYFFGGLLLGFLGKNYLEALTLLKIFVLSSFLIAIYDLFIPIQNVRMKVESIVKLNFAWFLLILGLSYVFLFKFGIVGIGYAWAITFGVLDLIIIVFVKKMGWLDLKKSSS